jgi:hypothetical protein
LTVRNRRYVEAHKWKLVFVVLVSLLDGPAQAGPFLFSLVQAASCRGGNRRLTAASPRLGGLAQFIEGTSDKLKMRARAE